MKKKYIAVFAVDNHWEWLRLFADCLEEAKDLAESVYLDYVKAGFIKTFDICQIKEFKTEK